MGVDDYDDVAIPPIPQAKNNVDDLHRFLTNPQLSFFDDESVVVLQMSERDQFLKDFKSIVQQAEHLILLYFVGHGILPEGDEALHLAPARMTKQSSWTAVSFIEICRLLRSAPATCRAVILDCCFSFRAMPSLFSGDLISTAGTADGDGLFLLTATTADRVAWSPLGQRNTTMTGLLLDILHRGVPGPSPTIALEDLATEVCRQARSIDGIHPQQVAHQLAGKLSIARNPVDRQTTSAEQLDTSKTTAVMIGVGRYDDPSIPRHLHSLTDAREMHELFLDPSISGVDADRSILLIDPQRPDDVLNRIAQAGRSDTDHLVIYISGYVKLDDHGDPVLPVTGSRLDVATSVLSARALAAALASARPATASVVLDISFSARFMPSLARPGTVVLGATGANAQARPVDGRGRMTNEILKMIRTGVPTRGPLLSLREVHYELRRSGLATEFQMPTNGDAPEHVFRNILHRSL